MAQKKQDMSTIDAEEHMLHVNREAYEQHLDEEEKRATEWRSWQVSAVLLVLAVATVGILLAVTA